MLRALLENSDTRITLKTCLGPIIFMEPGTSALLYTLLFIGFLVAMGYVYLSMFNPVFLGNAIAIWIIVVIVVFVTVIIEIMMTSEK
jgi:hypothetical protein